MLRVWWIAGASLMVHAALGVAVGAIDEPAPPPRVVRITLREPPPNVPEAEPTPPPPSPEPTPVPEAPAPVEAPPPPSPRPPRPQPAPSTPPPAPSPAPPPQFGFQPGPSTTGSGTAVPVGDPNAAPGSGNGMRQVRRESRNLASDATAEPIRASGDCDQADVRAAPVSMSRPRFTPEALAQNIEGRVRVRITVSIDGAVTEVQVLEGLGYGLDEAAIEAARAARFTPASRCGRPIETSLTISVTFQR